MLYVSETWTGVGGEIYIGLRLFNSGYDGENELIRVSIYEVSVANKVLNTVRRGRKLPEERREDTFKSINRPS